MGGSFERRPQAALVEQWLAHDGARATGHRLDPAALEDARHDFLVEVVLATATGFLTRLGAIESQAAQRRYVQRAFLSFVLRRRGAMDEAGRLRAFVRELLKGEPPPELRRQKDPTDGAVWFGLAAWGAITRRFTGAWSQFTEQMREQPGFLRRRRHHGRMTWRGEDVLIAVHRLLTLCGALALRGHLGKGVVASGWFDVVDLHSPVPSSWLEQAGAEAHWDVWEAVVEVRRFARALAPPERLALEVELARARPGRGLSQTEAARQAGVTPSGMSRRCQRIREHLEGVLARYTPAERVFAVRALFAEFESTALPPRDQPVKEAT